MDTNQFIHNLSELMTGLRENPDLTEAFRSPSAPSQMLDFLKNVNLTPASAPADGPASAVLCGIAMKRSESGLLAMDRVLQNDLLLELIFSHCSTSDLKNCRQVSKRWLDVSFKAWRKEAVFCLKDSEDNTPFIHLSVVVDALKRIESGSAHTHQLLMKPYSAYHFRWSMKSDSAPYGDCIDELRNQATYLSVVKIQSFRDLVSLIFSEFWKLSHFRADCFRLRRPYPRDLFDYSSPHESLKVLEIRSTTVDRGFPWTRFLRLLPHLQKMILGFNSRTGDNGEALSTLLLREFLKALGSLREESEDILSLTELDLLRYHRPGPIHRMEAEIPALLQKCELPLERFAVDLGAKTKPARIRRMLMPFSGTLKFLRVTRGLYLRRYSSIGSTENINMLKEWVGNRRIILDELQELRLLNGPCWGFHLLSYLEAPMLKKLVFESDIKMRKESDGNKYKELDREFHEAEVVYAFLEQKMFSSLVTFEYEHDQHLLGSKDIQALGKAIPNLKHLAIPLSKETFKDVCRMWPGLKSLDVRKCEDDFPEVDDEAITGFAGIRMGSSLPPNVTDLREVTDLAISCERTLKRKDVKFTDHSITHGFLKLPRLHFLSIAFNQISEDARTALEGHVHYVHYQ